MSSTQGHYDEWRFVLGARIPSRALQLVATISDHPHDPGKQRLYFYLAIMCAPITREMLKESEGLREWCNNQQEVDTDGDTYTWSADGFYSRVASAKCVVWNHASIEQFSLPKSNARKAAIAIGTKLAQILKRSCSGEASIELLFAIREGKWIDESPGAIGYAVAVGALAQVLRACQSALLLHQLTYELSDFEYFHRPPHISVLDLVALQNFGTLLFYTYRGHEDAASDHGLLTVFFGPQEHAVRYYVERGYWTEIDANTFLKYTHGSDYEHAVSSPQKLDVLKKYCDMKAARTKHKTSPTRARTKEMRKLSRRMTKLRLSPKKPARS